MIARLVQALALHSFAERLVFALLAGFGALFVLLITAMWAIGQIEDNR
jgi:hypothetical protein